jgi:hypothetical protein
VRLLGPAAATNTIRVPEVFHYGALPSPPGGGGLRGAGSFIVMEHLDLRGRCDQGEGACGGGRGLPVDGRGKDGGASSRCEGERSGPVAGPGDGAGVASRAPAAPSCS